MKPFVIIAVTLLAITAGPAPAGPQGAAPPLVMRAGERDVTARESAHAMDLVFSGRVHSALAYLETLAPECEGQPLFCLTRARVNRELLPVDDENKDGVKELAKVMYTDLDTVVTECTLRLDRGEDNPRLYLYRGWAHMYKSHVHTFEKSFWSAGREAKKGKNDLETYLQSYPRDPIANSIMGAFLYFADTLPAAYKFVSKLLFLPGGDRDRGLQMMELAVGWNSLVERDNRLILYSVYIGFEGRYEEGLEGFDMLYRRYPSHSTFLRPFAAMAVLKPGYNAAAGDELDRGVAVIDSIPPDETDRATFWLLHFMRGYANRYYDPETGRAQLEEIVTANPDHPDWVPGYAAFALGRMYAARGMRDEAKRLFLGVINDASVGYLQSLAQSMLSGLDDKYSPGDPDPALVKALYADSAGAVRAREQLQKQEERSAARSFYLGEALFALGDNEGAYAAYVAAVGADSKRWEGEFQMLAATRAGELAGLRGDYVAAATWYNKAANLWQKEFLFDWLFEGRERYFKRLAEGEEFPPAFWFATRPGSSTPAYVSAPSAPAN